MHLLRHSLRKLGAAQHDFGSLSASFMPQTNNIVVVEMRLNQGFVIDMQFFWGKNCLTRLIAAIPEASLSIWLPQVRFALTSIL